MVANTGSRWCSRQIRSTFATRGWPGGDGPGISRLRCHGTNNLKCCR
jgi:hypothetical protein